MKKQFNLSKKRIISAGEWRYREKDIKEFLRLLNLYCRNLRPPERKKMRRNIKNLAGEELSNSPHYVAKTSEDKELDSSDKLRAKIVRKTSSGSDNHIQGGVGSNPTQKEEGACTQSGDSKRSLRPDSDDVCECGHIREWHHSRLGFCYKEKNCMCKKFKAKELR